MFEMICGVVKLRSFWASMIKENVKLETPSVLIDLDKEWDKGLFFNKNFYMIKNFNLGLNINFNFNLRIKEVPNIFTDQIKKLRQKAKCFYLVTNGGIILIH